MKVEKAKLKSALSKLAVLVNKENTQDGNPTRILFEAENGKISLTSCDGSSLGIFSFETADQSSMDFVCDYRTLSAATVMRGDVDLVCENGILTISQGDTKMKYPVKGKDSYPTERREVESEKELVIASEKLKKLMGKISYIRKEKDPRPFTTGIHMVYDGEKLQMEATDGPRIYRNFTLMGEKQDYSFNGVIVARTVKLIESIEDEVEVHIKMDDTAISIQTGDMKVYLPNLNVKFPPIGKLFDNFFNNDQQVSFKLDKSVSLESIGIFSVSDNKALSLSNENGKLLFSMDDGVTDIKDKIDFLKFSGEDFQFAIDLDLFGNLFKNLRDSESVEFIWEEETSPVYFRDEENMDGLLMPLKK